MTWLALVVLSSSCAVRTARDLRPFKSDGCSCFPDGPPGDPRRWHAACVAHDRAYWEGGTADERLQADRALRQAIRDRGHPLTSEVVYLGVRLGGLPWLPTPWRWGFGWSFPRGYRTLSPQETAQVATLAPKPPR